MVIHLEYEGRRSARVRSTTMDPNVTLAQLRELTARLLAMGDRADVKAIELAELFDSLDGWITAGGFTPDAWK